MTHRRIGIPRALLFHRYGDMWRAFLETLGCEVVLSAPTGGRAVREGTRIGESELCLPVKVFFGHVAELDGEVDAVFVPRIVAVERERFTCPKFLGLPDMTRALGMRTPVIGPTFDLRLGLGRNLLEAYRLARSLGGSPARSVHAMARGWRAHREARRRHLSGAHIDALGPIDTDPGTVRSDTDPASDRGDRRPLRIGVASHPYNLYDEHVSLRLLERLVQRGCEVLTPEQVAEEDIERAARRLPKDVFWTYEREVVGTVLHWLDHEMVDGVVYMLSFACGPDSFMQVVIDDEVRADGRVPMMSLVLDEHSAEAGFLTRLEAFLDMLERREALGRTSGPDEAPTREKARVETAHAAHDPERAKEPVRS